MSGGSSFNSPPLDLRAEKARRTSEIAEQIFLKHFDPAEMLRQDSGERLDLFVDFTVAMARRIVDESYDGWRG